MSFTEELKIIIETKLDSGAFTKLKTQLAAVNVAMNNMQSPLDTGQMFANFTEKAEMLEDKLQGLNLKPRSGEDQAMFTDTQTGQPVSEKQAAMRKFRDEMNKSKIAAANLSEQTNTISFSKSVTNAERLRNAMSGTMSEIDDMETPQIAANMGGGAGTSFAGEAVRKAGFSSNVGATRMEESLAEIRSQATPTTRSLRGTGSATGRLREAFSIAKVRVQNFEGTIGSLVPSLQSLQMKLLGVQFSLLSLAFIFGGLMMSALSAVGIFQILGNTLKMFFLPTALDLIPAVSDLKDAILSIDEETKKSIGRIFMIVSAVGAFGSILAFTTSGVLGFLKGFKMLFSPIAKLLMWLTDAESVLQLVKNGFSAVKTIAGGLKAAIGGIISFLIGFAAGFLIVTRTAKKFGKKVAAMVGMVVILLAGIGAAVALFLGAPFFVVAGLIGVAFGAIAGIIWTFRDTIIGIFTGLVEAVIGVFKWLWDGLKWIFNKIVNTVVDLAGGLFDTLVGNSIFPDMVKDIIDWFFKIPKKIAGLGSSIVDTLIQGIKSAGSAVWEAFKKILPDFLVDAIEGAGKAIKGVVSAGGDIIGSAGNAIGEIGKGLFEGAKNFGSSVVEGAKNFVSGGSDKANNASPKKNGDNGSQTIQNDVTANVTYQGDSSTPQEDGRRWARGGTEELNNRQSSSFSNGT